MLEITKDSIQFINYPYKQSMAYHREVLAEEILGFIDFPFSCVLKNTRLGEPFYELVRLDYTQKEEFYAFARRHNIHEIEHTDNWVYLLEEYLDTEYEESTHKTYMQRLKDNGFTQQEIDSIKAREGKMVDSYNMLAWEWISFDVFDLLDIRFHWGFKNLQYKIFPQSFNSFYTRAMRIALKGCEIRESSV